ncbi:MAG: hypothetical protein KAW14_11120 [Candidatus Aegiribacteria sp.]|nr:hypothetical protein [Candidatus Aegiribacteria sp.]
MLGISPGGISVEVKATLLIDTKINTQNSAADDVLPKLYIDTGNILEPPYITANRLLPDENLYRMNP